MLGWGHGGQREVGEVYGGDIGDGVGSGGKDMKGWEGEKKKGRSARLFGRKGSKAKVEVVSQRVLLWHFRRGVCSSL